MDVAYEVHKKIQEAIQMLDIYHLSSAVRSSTWGPNIKKGLVELHEKLHELAAEEGKIEPGI